MNWSIRSCEKESNIAEIRPTKPQFEFLTTQSRFPAFVAGFGAGKTEAIIQRSIIGKLANPSTDRGFYEPTWDLVRMIAWPRFEEILGAMGIPYRLLKSPLNYIDLYSYGKIFFRSMDNPGRIIGYQHADADVDELDTLKKKDAADVWRRILSRNRQKKPDGSDNTVSVATTPEGFKYVYDTWKRFPKEGYELIHASTHSNPYLPEDYIATLEAIYPKNLLDAYIAGLFVNLTAGSVYSEYDRYTCRSDEEVKGNEALFIGMDFNVTKMSAVVYVRRKGVYHGVHEFHSVFDTVSIIDAIRKEFPDNPVTIYPDASGKSRKTVDASVSDHSLLRQAGFRLKVREGNPRVRDRVIAANCAFSGGKVLINDTLCPETAECLENLAYDEKKGEPDKGSDYDHLTDAATYLIAYEMPVRKPISKSPIEFPL